MRHNITRQSELTNVRKPMWEAGNTKHETSISFTCPFSVKYLFPFVIITLIIEDHISLFKTPM